MHRENGQVRALLLDALGTLVELEPPAPALRDELARRFGVAIVPADAERALTAEIAYYRAHLDEGRDRASVTALRRRCAGVVSEALALEDRISVDELTAALVASLRFRAFPEVLRVLGSARARGIRLVVVSNWDFSLHEVMARLGIASLVDGVLTSAEVGVRKPAPEIFRRALAIARVPAPEAVHVGDSPGEDVVGARAAGIRAVLISRDRAPSPGTGERTRLPEGELGVSVIRTLADLELAGG